MKTQKQIEAMSLEERRIATAELCFPHFPVFKENGELRHQYDGDRSGPVFNYPADLNAMHEAEETLDSFQQSQYISVLCGITEDVEMEGVTFATALQRNTAFLMIMLP